MRARTLDAGASGARGRTRAGRLRLLDAHVVSSERALFDTGGLVVDVGIGDEPHTTIELADALARAGLRADVLGVDIDEARVARAKGLAPGNAASATARVDFRVGGLSLPLAEGERPVLVRAMNVLRQYREEDVSRAHALLGSAVCEGGLVIEGTSDVEGHVLAAHLLRRRGEVLVPEALLFQTDFARGFAPPLFRDVLPRDLRRRVRAGEPIFDFFEAWSDAFFRLREDGLRDPRALFEATAAWLSARGVDVKVDVEAGARALRGTLVLTETTTQSHEIRSLSPE